MTASTAGQFPPAADGSLDLSDEADLLERMSTLFAQHGDVYQVHVPDVADRAYVIHHPDDVARVLASNQRSYTKGTGIERVRLLLGTGSMTAEGETWKTHRRATQPLVHAHSFETLDAAIADAQRQLVSRWEWHADADQPIDVGFETSRFAADVIHSSMFGEDADAIRTAGGVSNRDLLAASVARDPAFAYQFRSIGPSIAAVAEERRMRPGASHDLLRMLMDAGLVGRALVDEVLTLLVAGHETVAAALAWAWCHIAELDAPVTDAEWFPEAAVKEAMRLHPPGWILSRQAVAHDVLGGFAVPAGTHVLIPVFLVHRDVRHWNDPDAFVARRFAPGSNPPTRFTYIPFGAGLRHCVGEAFAMREMTMHLSMALGRFRLRRVDSRPVVAATGINLRPAHPIMMRVERRR
jgi:cytochrome P450